MSSPTAPPSCHSALPATYEHERAVVYGDDDQPSGGAGVSGEALMYDVDPKLWGAHFWAMMHLVAYAYPQQPDAPTRQAVYQLYDALRFALPCAKCRDGYRALWTRHPLAEHMRSRAALIEWTERVHADTNAKVGAPAFNLRAYLAQLLGEDVFGSDDEDDADSGSGSGNGDGGDDGDDPTAAAAPTVRTHHATVVVAPTTQTKATKDHRPPAQVQQHQHHQPKPPQARHHVAHVGGASTVAKAPTTAPPSGPAKRTPQPRGANHHRARHRQAPSHAAAAATAAAPWHDSGYARRSAPPGPMAARGGARRNAHSAAATAAVGATSYSDYLASAAAARGSGNNAVRRNSVHLNRRARASRNNSVVRKPRDCPECGGAPRELHPSMF